MFCFCVVVVFFFPGEMTVKIKQFFENSIGSD